LRERGVNAPSPVFQAEWNDDVEVYAATSDEVPGLRVEAATIQGLVKKLKVSLQERLALANPHASVRRGEMPFSIQARRRRRGSGPSR
jgi:hypothetical protein